MLARPSPIRVTTSSGAGPQAGPSWHIQPEGHADVAHGESTWEGLDPAQPDCLHFAASCPGSHYAWALTANAEGQGQQSFRDNVGPDDFSPRKGHLTQPYRQPLRNEPRKAARMNLKMLLLDRMPRQSPPRPCQAVHRKPGLVLLSSLNACIQGSMEPDPGRRGGSITHRRLGQPCFLPAIC